MSGVQSNFWPFGKIKKDSQKRKEDLEINRTVAVVFDDFRSFIERNLAMESSVLVIKGKKFIRASNIYVYGFHYEVIILQIIFTLEALNSSEQARIQKF